MLPFFLPVLCPISTYIFFPLSAAGSGWLPNTSRSLRWLGGCGMPGRAQQPLQILQHHVRPAVSGGQAALVGSLPATKHMNLSIVMPLRNQDELTSLLSRLMTPPAPITTNSSSVKQFTEQSGPRYNITGPCLDSPGPERFLGVR